MYLKGFMTFYLLLTAINVNISPLPVVLRTDFTDFMTGLFLLSISVF